MAKTCDPHNCCTLCAWIVLIVGVLFLLRDVAGLNYTFGIQWYTVVFLLFGLKCIMNRK
jgi:hypothetical protein